MMAVLISLTAGALVAAAAYLLTGRRLLHLILGAALLTHGVNLAVFASGSIHPDGVPIAPAGATSMPTGIADPLPQALVLTAIVIGFGVLAFLLALSYRVQRSANSDDIDIIAKQGNHA
ncbi:MAG: NADH-quinone oxidoreductase subunit K [Planctomycetota bacterium]|jgi:multicomponent Na+:H+ antiporter subunit C|nr:NADH-quinone oxidoreductase subunit K [Planctomycetota bacterium]